MKANLWVGVILTLLPVLTMGRGFGIRLIAN